MVRRRKPVMAVATIEETVESVKDVVEEGLRTARRAVTQGRHAAEDLVDRTVLEVRQKPLRAMGWTFAAGALMGCTFGWMLARTCRKAR